jgi:LDH2 family malate/lactate/ureidoglycolate dehydrogenase
MPEIVSTVVDGHLIKGIHKTQKLDCFYKPRMILENGMKLRDIKRLLVNATIKYVTLEEAEYFAAEVTETDVRKIPEKKYNQGIINDIKSWESKTEDIEKKIDLPGFTQYDFHGLGPSLKLKAIHDDLEKKARQNGIAMISIINSGGMHTMHLWTQGLAKRGLFAFAGWNGGPDAVIPFNGTKGIFGTNPLTYGFPSDNGEVVIDMATSEIPFFKIVEAKKFNTPLPPNTAVDNDGQFTTNPNDAINEHEVSNLAPMGSNYKGYNINYLIEIMTSALIGAKVSSEMSNSYIETEHGGFIIAIAIDQITDRSKYDTSVSSMNKKIRSQKPKLGVDKVIVPGDRNLENKSGITDDSEIEVDEKYAQSLVDLASP